VLRARERVPNSLLFRCFHYRLPLESIKELGNASHGTQYTIWGKVVASFKSGLWWVLWVQICLCFIHAPKCFNYILTNWSFSLCKFVWVIELLVNLPSPISELQHALLPPKCCDRGSAPQLLSFHCLHLWIQSWIQQGAWGCIIKSQIGNLTHASSFGHNLCLKYLNGSCKAILDIYVSRAFQWYKDIFNPMNFDPCNYPLKIWESIKTSIPKVRVHLGTWGFTPSRFPTLLGTWNVTPKFHSWLAPSQALPWSRVQG